jgi:hypothetical protein
VPNTISRRGRKKPKKVSSQRDSSHEDRRLKSQSGVHSMPYPQDPKPEINYLENFNADRYQKGDNSQRPHTVGPKTELDQEAPTGVGCGFETFKLINNQMDTIKSEFIRLSEEIRGSTGRFNAGDDQISKSQENSSGAYFRYSSPLKSEENLPPKSGIPNTNNNTDKYFRSKDGPLTRRDLDIVLGDIQELKSQNY